MLESIETRGIVLYNREFREDDKLVKIFHGEVREADVFCETCGKITVESHVATFGNGRYVVENQ